MKRIIAAVLIFAVDVAAGTVRIPGPGGASGSAPTDTSFITSVTGGSSMNNFTGYLGGDFTLSSTKTLTAIGRYCLSGNSLTHDLWVVHSDNSGVIDHQLVDMTGCTPGTFVYVAASGTLTSGMSYACVSGELNGGDTWLDYTSTVTTTAVGSFSIGAGDSTSIPPATPVLNFTFGANADYVPCNVKLL